MIKQVGFVCLAGAALVSLGACDDMREAMGMQRVSPDEYAVTTNPPLSLPPEYNLKPPRETPKDVNKDKPAVSH